MALSKYDIELDLANRPGTSHAFLVEMTGANKRVLDVGCDTGYLGEALTALGDEVSGFEVNPVTAAEARKKLHRVEIGDLQQVDLVGLFGRGSFDVVIFGDVLEHLIDPLPVLRQARPLLAPGGSVLISVPNIAHGDVRLALLQGRFNYTKVGILDETHTKFFTRDSLVSFLRDAGFVLVELNRTRAELFSTEVGVRAEDFDPAIVESIRADPESSTYQFIARAVPDDAAAVTAEQALRVDSLQSELAEARRRVEELLAERDTLARAVEEANEASARRDDQVAQLQASHDSAHAQLHEAQSILSSRPVQLVLRARRVRR